MRRLVAKKHKKLVALDRVVPKLIATCVPLDGELSL